MEIDESQTDDVTITDELVEEINKQNNIMTYDPFGKLVRFVGTYADFTNKCTSGSLVFGQISDHSDAASGAKAPYYIWANDKEFAIPSHAEFVSLYNSVGSSSDVASATGSVYARINKLVSDLSGVKNTADAAINGASGEYLSKDANDTNKLKLTIQSVADSSESTKGLAEASDVKSYVDIQVAGKNVTAEGDSYVGASASNNKVTISATQSTKDSLAKADSAVQSVSGDGVVTASKTGTDVSLTHADSGVTAGSVGSGATKESNSVKFNIPSVTVDSKGHVTAASNNEVSIVASDLGLSNAMHFRGKVDTLPTELAGYADGDVILCGTKEYVLGDVVSGETTTKGWIELGDEGSHALKTVSITGTDGLTGGGDLSENRTIGLSAETKASLAKADSAVQDANYKHITVTETSVSDGTNTFNKYVHPTTTAVAAAAVKVGYDNQGHVVIGDALAAGDITYGETTVAAAIAAIETKGHNTVEGSEYVKVVSSTDGDHSKYTVSAETKALGSAVGMVKQADGTWKAADGTVTTDGLVTAADTAAEIVADEQVIAAALNDHESRIKVLETKLQWEVIG